MANTTTDEATKPKRRKRGTILWDSVHGRRTATGTRIPDSVRIPARDSVRAALAKVLAEKESNQDARELSRKAS